MTDQINKSVDVKPCPFCGEKMTAKEELSTNNGAIMTYREISHKRPIQNCIPPLSDYSGDKVKAENIFDMWNRRSTGLPDKLFDEAAFKKALNAYEAEITKYDNYHLSSDEDESESDLEQHEEGIKQAILAYLERSNKDSEPYQKLLIDCGDPECIVNGPHKHLDKSTKTGDI